MLTVVGFVPVPPGQVCGTVLGWLAVAQVAAFGHAVAATVGETVPYGSGPGTAL